MGYKHDYKHLVFIVNYSQNINKYKSRSNHSGFFLFRPSLGAERTLRGFSTDTNFQKSHLNSGCSLCHILSPLNFNSTVDILIIFRASLFFFMHLLSVMREDGTKTVFYFDLSFT